MTSPARFQINSCSLDVREEKRRRRVLSRQSDTKIHSQSSSSFQAFEHERTREGNIHSSLVLRRKNKHFRHSNLIYCNSAVTMSCERKFEALRGANLIFVHNNMSLLLPSPLKCFCSSSMFSNELILSRNAIECSSKQRGLSFVLWCSFARFRVNFLSTIGTFMKTSMLIVWFIASLHHGGIFLCHFILWEALRH